MEWCSFKYISIVWKLLDIVSFKINQKKKEEESTGEKKGN